MLLDLGRNDTGRVSKAGSVRVVDSFAIERYSHVMHIASEFRGRSGTSMLLMRSRLAFLQGRFRCAKDQGDGDH